MESNNIIHIALSIDNNYVQHCAVLIASILKNNQHETFHFHVLDGGISQKNKFKIEKLKKLKNFSISYYNMLSYDFSFLPLNRKHISIATYYRLVLPQILPSNIEKILYLDTDIVVVGSLSNFYNTDISSVFAGVVEDENSRYQAKRLNLNNYFNAGVLLLNLKKIRESNFQHDWVNYYEKNQKMIILQDQDILNGTFADKVLYLPLKWNANSPLFLSESTDHYYTLEDAKQAKRYKTIIHYTGIYKPWSSKYHPLRRLYYKYLLYTPFKLNIVSYPLIKFRELLKQIFSITNENNDKVMKLFGIKVRIKHRKELVQQEKEKTNTVNVVFAINNQYVKQLSTTLISILRNSNSNFNFFVLHSDISEKNKNIFYTMLKRRKNSSIKFIDISEYIKKINLKGLMAIRKDYNYISIETYFRFFIPELFQEYDKIVYLDADIVVFGNLKNLYNIDLGDNYLGVIQDTFLEAFSKDINMKTSQYPDMSYGQYFEKVLNKKTHKYFNAGILLFNVKKMHKDNMTEKLFKNAIENSPLEFQDQDVLNSVLENHVLYLDYKWNILKDLKLYLNCFDKEKRAYLKKCYTHPYIYHYVQNNKPWLIHDNYNYDNIFAWWKFFKESPFFTKEDKRILSIINSKILRVKTKKILQTIFSVNNSGNYKIVTICGIKFRFKRKYKCRKYQ